MEHDRTETLYVGSSVPDFSLEAANRDGMFTLSQFLEQGILLIEVLRGTWCQKCRKRMAELEQFVGRFQEIGMQVVYLAAEKRNGIWKPAEFLKNNAISFPFLLDEDRRVTRSFGLYHAFALDALDIAHPATIIVGPDRTIRYIYRGFSQSDRAPMNGLMGLARNTARRL
jgi:peroxiredoxin